MPHTPYRLDVDWHDPFDPKEERRRYRRESARFTTTMRVDVPGSGGAFVGPAMVQNISIAGICAVTKHDLHLDDRVTLTIDTAECPFAHGHPEVFTSVCIVSRIEPMNGRQIRVALILADDLKNHMGFAQFVTQLRVPANLAS